jgi:hypothetical protein
MIWKLNLIASGRKGVNFGELNLERYTRSMQ